MGNKYFAVNGMKVLMFTAGEVKLLLSECGLRLIVGICLRAAKIQLQDLLEQPDTWESRPWRDVAGI